MSQHTQTIIAFAIVALAAVGLIWRAIAKRKSPGCGGDCGCASSELKAKIKR